MNHLYSLSDMLLIGFPHLVFKSFKILFFILLMNVDFVKFLISDSIRKSAYA